MVQAPNENPGSALDPQADHRLDFHTLQTCQLVFTKKGHVMWAFQCEPRYGK
ncbi:hypothetical protein DPMN_184167 [Dreissena polymorpha]|uniref:Uncharacterized protein n=1 Tax=Dreissena polymorpha TaxID=45954 RepID=A0A9D4I652_DREPO|nr:hypothetical protein DPMN_184167 [Dreissena polymorpha]